MKLNKILFVVMIFCAVNCFAQETKWTRIEFEKTVSVSLPDGFLVDAEKRENAPKYWIWNGEGLFQIAITVFKDSNAKKTVENIRKVANDSEKQVIDKIIVRRFISNQNEIKENDFLIGTSNRYYIFTLLMEKEDDSRALRFINSIKINGKAVFPQNVEANNANESLLIESDIQMTPEIATAWHRKIDKSEDYIKVSSMDEIIKEPNISDKYSRKLILLKDPYSIVTAEFFKRSLQSAFSGGSKKDLGEVAVRVILLANGDIGEIKVFSTASEKDTKFVVKAMRETIFVPAQVDGKNVNTVYSKRIGLTWKFNDVIIRDRFL